MFAVLNDEFFIVCVCVCVGVCKMENFAKKNTCDWEQGWGLGWAGDSRGKMQ